MSPYPAKLSPEAEGGYAVTFRDLGEAVAFGESEEEAIDKAGEVLADVLSYYAEDGKAFPDASAPKRGEKLVFLPVIIQAKLALWARMGELGLTKVELAARLGIDEKAARRMLRLDYHSGVDKIEAAPTMLGRRSVFSVSAV
ncbi:MAG: type II toxin-antitoxin system HicB family antitoxin [Rhizobiales bacterium]|nr:type II toxin-antitoxin system HicB family antitoxin [Hyphomicrobiales bacterium]